MKTRTLILLLLLSLSSVALAQAVATVTHLSGVLTVKRPDGSSKLLSVKSAVEQGDTLVTESSTYARLKFADASEIMLRPGSQLKIEQFSFDPAKPGSDKLVLNMLKGGMRAVSGAIGKRNTEAVAYTTATATIGIRGTHFGMLNCAGDCGAIATASGQPPSDGLYVDVASGGVVVTNAAGNQIVNAGQFGYVASRDSLPVVVPPSQGIQVTMPPSISRNQASNSAGKDGNAAASDDARCVVQ